MVDLKVSTKLAGSVPTLGHLETECDAQPARSSQTLAHFLRQALPTFLAQPGSQDAAGCPEECKQSQGGGE